MTEYIEELFHIRHMDLTTLIKACGDKLTYEDIKKILNFHCNICGLVIKNFQKHIDNRHSYDDKDNYINKFRRGIGVKVSQRGTEFKVERPCYCISCTENLNV